MLLWVEVVIAAMVVVAIGVLAAALVVGRRRRTARLKERFGPEYDGTPEVELLDRERSEAPGTRPVR